MFLIFILACHERMVMTIEEWEAQKNCSDIIIHLKWAKYRKNILWAATRNSSLALILKKVSDTKKASTSKCDTTANMLYYWKYSFIFIHWSHNIWTVVLSGFLHVFLEFDQFLVISDRNLYSIYEGSWGINFSQLTLN